MDNIEFGARVKDLREKKGLNQAQLAELTGVKQNTICSIELGARGASLKLLCKLKYALNTTTDYLLGLTPDPTDHFLLLHDGITYEDSLILRELAIHYGSNRNNTSAEASGTVQ